MPLWHNSSDKYQFNITERSIDATIVIHKKALTASLLGTYDNFQAHRTHTVSFIIKYRFRLASVTLCMICWYSWHGCLISHIWLHGTPTNKTLDNSIFLVQAALAIIYKPLVMCQTMYVGFTQAVAEIMDPMCSYFTKGTAATTIFFTSGHSMFSTLALDFVAMSPASGTCMTEFCN